MKRIAIIGGGISGLTAAYELEQARKRGAAIDWHLYEATDRLGGIIETTRIDTPEGRYVLEGGPDGWVSEKPWARELAIELGLKDELIYSNDAERKTYILINGKLEVMPDGMRMMVPTDLAALDGSPLFSATARQAYRDEITRVEELKASALTQDESVANFVRRHFGDEVLEKVAAPLLSGVFGGDVHKLSVRAVMPAFVKMEHEHGSLILALQHKAAERGNKPPQPTFTSLKSGMASVIEALCKTLPHTRYETGLALSKLFWDEEEWALEFIGSDPIRAIRSNMVDEIVLATPLDATRRLLAELDPIQTTLLPSSGGVLSLAPEKASSAVLVTFCWPAEIAQSISIPPGFGFLVPQTANISAPTKNVSSRPEQDSSIVLRSGETCSSAGSATSADGFHPQLLAATFTNQKFPHRIPSGAKAIRVFFGSDSTERFADKSDEEVAQTAFQQLTAILGPLPAPAPAFTTVRRWPRSLPQYEVGHLDRMVQLDELVSRIPGLHLVGNSYRGVGLPDLIRDARATAKRILE